MRDLEALLRRTLAERAESAEPRPGQRYAAALPDPADPASQVAVRVARLRRGRVRRRVGGSALAAAAVVAAAVLTRGAVLEPTPQPAGPTLSTTSAVTGPMTASTAYPSDQAALAAVVERSVREWLYAHPEQLQRLTRPADSVLGCGVVLVHVDPQGRYGYVDTFCGSYLVAGTAPLRELETVALPMRVGLGQGSAGPTGPVVLTVEQPRLGADYAADVQRLIPDPVRPQIGPKTSAQAQQQALEQARARLPLPIPAASGPAAAAAATAAYLASLDPEVRAVLVWMHEDPQWRRQAMFTSRGGTVGCGVRIYGRSAAGDELYVGALCQELAPVPGGLASGSGSALPARLHVRGAGQTLVVDGADIPQDSNYVQAVSAWFPPEVARQIFAGVGTGLTDAAHADARARLGLPDAPIVTP